jgi:hypothetical protein
MSKRLERALAILVVVQVAAALAVYALIFAGRC